ncbi:RNA polymerase sigma-70 factor [Parapedobacter defluvii]|nr:RNA polymerase sigma-70 factor [Parapedobacter defluvii]
MAESTYISISDQALLDRIRNDDQVAFKELYRRHWQRCYRMVMRRSGDSLLAEDLTQAVFVSLWEKRKDAVIQNLASYLFVAVRFRFISYLKSQMRESAYREHLLHVQEEGGNPVEASYRLKELNAAIDKGVDMMPPKTKTVYTMSRNGQYSVKEIARKLNLSEKAVEYHITQSLKTMRLVLRDFLPFLLFVQEIF